MMSTSTYLSKGHSVGASRQTIKFACTGSSIPDHLSQLHLAALKWQPALACAIGQQVGMAQAEKIW